MCPLLHKGISLFFLIPSLPHFKPFISNSFSKVQSWINLKCYNSWKIKRLQMKNYNRQGYLHSFYIISFRYYILTGFQGRNSRTILKFEKESFQRIYIIWGDRGALQGSATMWRTKEMYFYVSPLYPSFQQSCLFFQNYWRVLFL